VTDVKCYELITVPIPCPPELFEREEVEKSGVQLGLGNRGVDWGEGGF